MATIAKLLALAAMLFPPNARAAVPVMPHGALLAFDDNATTHGTAVATWSNAGLGAADAVQSTSSARPSAWTSSVAEGVAFDGVADCLDVDGVADDMDDLFNDRVWELFVAVRVDAVDSGHILSSASSTAHKGMVLTARNGTDDFFFQMWNGTATVATDDTTWTYAAGELILLHMFGDGTNVQWSRDFTSYESVAYSGAAVDGPATNDLAIGARFDCAANFLDGAVHGLWYYKEALTAGQRTQAKVFLQRRYPGYDAELTRRVVAMGDSITYSTTTYSDVPYPHRVEIALGTDAMVANMGVSGQQSAAIVTLWDLDVEGEGYTDLVLMVGVNDARNSVGDAATSFANIDTIYDEAVVDGLTVYGCTVTPFKNSSWDSTKESHRDDLNALIVAEEGITLIDTADCLADPADEEQILDAYTSDDLHPNSTGVPVLATCVGDAL